MDFIKKDLLERFVRYVKVDSPSDPESKKTPSTDSQWNLAKILEQECKDLGLLDVKTTENCYVYASLPSHLNHANHQPTIGLIAHLDTSSEVSGCSVCPVVHENYNGKDLILSEDSLRKIPVKKNPLLKKFLGDTIITSNGATLLGADDKAGISIIMTLVAYLKQHPEIPRPNIKIVFTPDEEIGHGAALLDIKEFNARCAYTVDGGRLWTLDYETFCADSIDVVITGVATHLGYAKNRLLNSMKAASEIIMKLPKRECPEKTEGKQGYIHAHKIHGCVEETKIHFVLRDFELKELKKKVKFVEKLVKTVCSKHKGITYRITVNEQYRNMRIVLDKHMEVVNIALEGMRKAGIVPELGRIRGGTDGAALCYRGLPTPDFFSGGQNFHSTHEWVALSVMEKALNALRYTLELWSEKTQA